MDKIFPFLWVKGESLDVIERELLAIKSFGIDSVCIESRTHPDFCGDSWFADMGGILEAAERLDMRVWLLDDAHYPTGYANGNIEKHPDCRAWRIKAEYTDVCGTLKGSKVYFPLKAEESLIGVYFVPYRNNRLVSGEAVDLTATYRKGYVTLPNVVGSFKVICLIKTHDGAERDYYIDMCNPKSVDRLIEAVYQPHYEHFKDYFGKTFVGFFSDEPRFANGTLPDYSLENGYHCDLGIVGACYPWNDEICSLLQVKGADLISLWWEYGENTSQIRCDYMRIVTDLYGKYFSGRLSNWCHARGVLYTGHIIEDMDAHTSMGCSAGHYFKSMQGSDIASVDVVLHQIKAYETQNITKACIVKLYTDPEFFLFTLAKLASSCARLDSEKQGRALCEIFGAYGHGESVKTMLFLLNHMVSRGINMFIPHAFSMENNDTDCPPYFYMGGKNPAIPGYKVLFGYMKRLCEEFSGGVADIKVAVIYHAEAKWSGKEFLPVDKVNRVLAENQIDYDIVPYEYFKNAVCDENGVKIGNVTYKTVILPYAEFLPKDERETLSGLERFLIRTERETFEQPSLTKALIERVRAEVGGVVLAKPERDLRVYTYLVGGKRKYFVFNEGCNVIENTMDFGDGTTGSLHLYAGQAVILDENGKESEPAEEKSVEELNGFRVYVKQYSADEFLPLDDGLHPVGFDIHGKDGYEDFSGAVKYAINIEAKQGDLLTIEYFGEYCEISVANKAQTFIDGRATYRFQEDYKGELIVTLGSSLGYAIHDYFSSFDRLEPVYLERVTLARS